MNKQTTKTKDIKQQPCSDYKQAARQILRVPGNPMSLTWDQTDLFIKEFCIEELKLPQNVTMKTCYRHVYQKPKELKEYLKKHYPYHFKLIP